MAPSFASSTASLPDRAAVWESLVQAIASSSGFERWLEQQPSTPNQPTVFQVFFQN
jgi:hypothetical protein